jgi:hypothetical protein
LLGFVGTGSVNGEIGTIHSAEIAARTFVRLNHVGRVIALGVDGGGECEDLGGAELYTEPASLAALNDDRHSTTCHASSFRVLAG